jgi:hypothetical protein
MKTAIAILALAYAFSGGAAQAAFKGCYERVYDAGYLRQHKKQQVMKIRLQIGVGQGYDGPFEYLDRLDAVLRNTRRYDGNLIECEPLGDELSCGIEADGGTFTVTDRGLDKGRQAIRITNLGYMNFGDDENGKSVEANGENREFRLYLVSDGPCP